VLLHGTGAWSEIWRSTMHTLAGAGYRVIAIDLPPFGYSKRPVNGDYSPEAQGRRILALFDALQLSDSIALVGHSFSARFAMEAALMAPQRISSLVLVDAALDLDPPSEPAPSSVPVRVVLGTPMLREAAVSATLTNPYFTRSLLLKLISDSGAATPQRVEMFQKPFVVTGTTEAYGQWLDGFLTRRDRTRSTRSALYRSLPLPTLVIWGARDAVTPLPQGRALAALIPGAHLVELPTAGHIPAIESPQQFDAAMTGFLREVLPLRASTVYSPNLDENGGEVKMPSFVTGTKRPNPM
jgi:pimeloyl-ACP methyl ester carboxylesterase